MNQTYPTKIPFHQGWSCWKGRSSCPLCFQLETWWQKYSQSHLWKINTGSLSKPWDFGYTRVGVTVFIFEQVPTSSVSEASKYRVLEAPFWRWFRNLPMPFWDGTGTLSVTASDSSCALPRLGSIGSIRKSSYFTFLTSNLWLLLFSSFITYILQGTLPHIADDIRQVYLRPYIYTCFVSHRHLSCFHHLGQQLRWVFSHFLLYS